MKSISSVLYKPNVDRWLSYRSILLISITMFLIKSINLLVTPSLWAEDANVFLGPLFINRGELLQSQFEVYNGQYWILNHFLFTLIFTSVNHNYLLIPFVSALASLTLTIVFASLWLRHNNVVQDKWFRAAIFAYILFGPSSWEVLGTITGIHSYFLVGVFSLIGWKKPDEFKWKLTEWTLILFGSFTSTSAVFLLIIYLFRMWRDKKAEISKIIVLTTAILIQYSIWITRASNEDFKISGDFISTLILGNVRRVGAELVIGQNGGTYLQNRINSWYFTILGVLVLSLFLHLIVFNRKRFIPNWERVVLGPAILFLTYLSLILSAISKGDISALNQFGWVGRYFYVVHFLTFLLVISIRLAIRSKTSLTFKIIQIIFVLGSIADFHVVPKNSIYPSTSWHEFTDCYKVNAGQCSVTVPPGAGWGINTPPGAAD